MTGPGARRAANEAFGIAAQREAAARKAIGTRVSYEDQANPRRYGTITDYTAPARFSGHYVVTWDHDGWSDEWSKATVMEIPALADARTNKNAGWRIEPAKAIEVTLTTQKARWFTDPSQVSDAEALGIALSKWSQWNGETICEAFLAALTDANYHTLAAQIKALVDVDLAQGQE